MDMDAGLEHLGRGTADMVDQFIVVVEPGKRSIQTYFNVRKLAADLGINVVRVIANKITTEEDEAFIRMNIPEEYLLGIVHSDEGILFADRAGHSPYETAVMAKADISTVKALIDKSTGGNQIGTVRQSL